MSESSVTEKVKFTRTASAQWARGSIISRFNLFLVITLSHERNMLSQYPSKVRKRMGPSLGPHWPMLLEVRVVASQSLEVKLPTI
jgi:hypothetical protein